MNPTVQVLIAFSPQLLTEIEELRREQVPAIPRSVLIRQLLREALDHRAIRKSLTPAR